MAQLLIPITILEKKVWMQFVDYVLEIGQCSDLNFTNAISD